MIINIYAFYDKKSSELSSPVFVQNDEILKRELKRAYEERTAKQLFIDYPEDFSVYKIGEFDSEAVKKDNALFICNCSEFKVEDKPNKE